MAVVEVRYATLEGADKDGEQLIRDLANIF
jgi:hypothetical protein